MIQLNVSSIEELRAAPAEAMAWPAAWPNFTLGINASSTDISPFSGMGGGPLARGAEFPGYFVDGAVLPEHPSVLYSRGGSALNVEQLMIGGTSRDGVALSS
jgi:hypothetical protein